MGNDGRYSSRDLVSTRGVNDGRYSSSNLGGGAEDLDGCKCKPKKCYKPNITIREKHHNKSLFMQQLMEA